MFSSLLPTLLQRGVSVRTMKPVIACLLTMVAFIALLSTMDAQTRRNRSFSVNTDGAGSVTNCADLRVTYDRRPAIAEESEMSLPSSQVSTLQTRMSNGGIYI